MKETKYILEIYEPESVINILISFTSASPFMPIERGALLDPQAWETECPPGKMLRVANVEHSISRRDAITHKLKIFTEQIEDRPEARYVRREHASSVFSRFRDRAKEIAKEIHPPELGGQGALFLEEQAPWIQVLLKEKVGPVAKDTLQNEESMTKAFRTVYEFLPTPIRLAVSAESFVAFCLKNRKRLIETKELGQSSPQPQTANSQDEGQ